MMRQVLRDFLKKISWNIPGRLKAQNQSPVKRSTKKPVKKSFSIMGFSLIELLTTVGILSVLSAVAIPIYSKYKNSSKKAAVESVLQSAYDKVKSNQLFDKGTELDELNKIDMVQQAGATWKKNSGSHDITAGENHWCLEINLGNRAYKGGPSCINASGEMGHKEGTNTGTCGGSGGCSFTSFSCPAFHSLQNGACERTSCPTGQTLQGSGSSASCAAIICPTGQRLNGNTCEAITCPAYHSLQGNNCVRTSCPIGERLQGTNCVAIICPTGERLNGNICEAITCPTGERLNGNICEAITCPTGQRLNGNTCEPLSCAANERIVGNSCVAPCSSGNGWNERNSRCEPCSSGTYSDRFECVACASPKIWDTTTNSCLDNCPPDRPNYNPSTNNCECPTGQRLSGSSCVAITCSTGQRLQGNTCVAITCRSGQRLQGNTCVAITCRSDQRLMGSTCMDPCPSGGGYPAGSTSCISCPSGTYSNTFECVACPSPKIWDTTTNSCLDNCPSDRPNHNPSTNNCECPTGQRLQGSSCEAITCPQYHSLRGNNCVRTSCPSWQILQGSDCVPRDNIQPGDCPPYHSVFYNSEAGKNDCTRTGCPPGERLTLDYSACIPCAAGERVVNRFYCVR